MKIKSRYFPDREFRTKEHLFEEFLKNKDILFDAKKAAIKHSDGVIMLSVEASKSIAKEMSLDSDFIYPIINTTRYMDSHDDVHIDGIWEKSVNDNGGKIWYIADHILKVGNIIAHKKYVEPFTKMVSWKSLGSDYSGETQALIYKIPKDKIILPAAKEIIAEELEIENSIRMQYVKYGLAINSDSADFIEQHKLWLKYINIIANKDRAIDMGYFWPVEEAKIYKEGSMVIDGSNDITPIVYPKIETDTPHSTDEPLSSTHGKSNILLFN